MNIISKIFGRDKKPPLRPRSRLEPKQANLQDFNIRNMNNNSIENLMELLDIDHVSFRRGDVNAERSRA